MVHLGLLAMTSTLDAVHSSSYLESLNLDPTLTQRAYTKLNARLGIGDDDDHWQVAVVGRNLTDRTTVGYAADAPLAQALFKAAQLLTGSWIRRAASRWNCACASRSRALSLDQRCRRTFAPVTSSSNPCHRVEPGSRQCAGRNAG